MKVKANEGANTGSVGNFTQFYNSLTSQLDVAIKAITAAKLFFFKAPGIPIPAQYKKSFLVVDALKLVKVPKLLGKFVHSNSHPEFIKNALSIYFCLFDVRKAFKWVPPAELPFAAVFGLGTVELFRQSLKTYMIYNDSIDHQLNGSIEQAERYIKDLRKAKYEAWESGIAMISSLSLSAAIFFPAYKGPLGRITSCSKLAGFLLPLFL